jgi:hypothetical protein
VSPTDQTMMATRPPPSPSRRASTAALPSGPPPPSRRASAATIPRRASTATQQQQQPSSSTRHQHYADIPMIDSDEGSQAGSEQRAVMPPPPPRTLSRRASTVAVARSGSTPREDDSGGVSQQQAGAAPPSGFAHYAFPTEAAEPPQAANRNRPLKQRAQSAVSLSQPYTSSTFYDPSIAAYDNANANSNAPPKSRSPPNPQQTPPLMFTQPAPAPQLLPPPPQQASGGAMQQSNPLRNPHAKVSGVEFHAPLPRLQATTEHAADRTRDAVYQFMEQLCPERATAVQSVMDQFSGRETLLMEAITSIFGDEWASHRNRQSNLLALEAAQYDVKAIMPVAMRHQPRDVRTTTEILDESPMRLRIGNHGPRDQGTRTAATVGSDEPTMTTPAVPVEYAARQSHAANASSTYVYSQPSPVTDTAATTPRDYLPPSSSRGSRPAFAFSSLGVSDDVIHTTHYTVAPAQHPTGINNSRPGTPMLSVQRSLSTAHDTQQQTQLGGVISALVAPSGRTTSPPQTLPLSAAENAAAVSLLPPPSSDPVMMVMATPSNGGILTPPLPDELVYQPRSHGTTHWRR